MLERPVRYVVEYAYTRFYGDLGVLGYEVLHSVLHSLGIGLDTPTRASTTSSSREPGPSCDSCEATTSRGTG